MFKLPSSLVSDQIHANLMTLPSAGVTAKQKMLRYNPKHIVYHIHL